MLAVTGTPGVGKKSVAPILAKVLKAHALDLNGLAISDAPTKEKGEYLVDVKKLRAKLLKADPSESVVFGHMVPEVLRRGEAGFVAVLRCEPGELKDRLRARGYPPTKVVENVEAELIGVVLDACLRRFGPTAVHEYDTTGATPRAIAGRIASDYRSGTIRKGPWTDWTLDYDSSTKLTSLLSSPRTEPAST
jgi:adenylate kinase